MHRRKHGLLGRKRLSTRLGSKTDKESHSAVCHRQIVGLYDRRQHAGEQQSGNVLIRRRIAVPLLEREEVKHCSLICRHGLTETYDSNKNVCLRFSFWPQTIRGRKSSIEKPENRNAERIWRNAVSRNPFGVSFFRNGVLVSGFWRFWETGFCILELLWLLVCAKQGGACSYGE